MEDQLLSAQRRLRQTKPVGVKCDGKALALGTVRDSQFYPSRVLNI